jgi:hypothetical protein
MLQLIESHSMHDTISEHNVLPIIHEIFNTAESGHVPAIPPLISPGHLKNGDGETLLIVGARCGHTAIVERFRNEIDIDEADNDGKT